MTLITETITKIRTTAKSTTLYHLTKKMAGVKAIILEKNNQTTNTIKINIRLPVFVFQKYDKF